MDGHARREVGQLQRFVCLRPDIAFTVKEFPRSLHGPAGGGFKRLRHLSRYIKGNLHFKMRLRPSITLPADFGQEADLRDYVDAIRAHCPSTGERT